MKSHELKSQRAETFAQAKKIWANHKSENRQITDEEKNQVDDLMRQVDAFDSQIENSVREEKLETVEASLKQVVEKPVQTSARSYNFDNKLSAREFDQALNAWARKDVSSSSRALCERAGFSPLDGQIQLSLRASHSIAGSNAGATTVPETWSDTIAEVLKWYCPIEKYVSVENTPHGRTHHVPKINTTSLSVGITAESTSSGENSFVEKAATITGTDFGSYSYGAYFVTSRQLERDSGYDIAGRLREQMLKVIARSMEADFIAGNNSGKPQGLIYGATNSNVTVGITTGPTAAKLRALKDSVDIAYRQSPKCAWVCSPTYWSLIEGVEDETGRPLLNGNLTDGYPLRLLGYPVILTTSADAGTSNSHRPLVFGDLSAFGIRFVNSLTFVRDEYTLATSNQIKYVVSMDADARYMGDTAAVKYLTSVTGT